MGWPLYPVGPNIPTLPYMYNRYSYNSIEAQTCVPNEEEDGMLGNCDTMTQNNDESFSVSF